MLKKKKKAQPGALSEGPGFTSGWWETGASGAQRAAGSRPAGETSAPRPPAPGMCYSDGQLPRLSLAYELFSSPEPLFSFSNSQKTPFAITITHDSPHHHQKCHTKWKIIHFPFPSVSCLFDCLCLLFIFSPAPLPVCGLHPFVYIYFPSSSLSVSLCVSLSPSLSLFLFLPYNYVYFPIL